MIKTLGLFLLIGVIAFGIWAGWTYYNAGLQIQAMQQQSAATDHRLKAMIGDVTPIYVITAQGKTWESKEKPDVTAYGITFTDDATGDVVRLSGPFAVELK